MNALSPFRTYSDPLLAEETVEVLQKNNILFERIFEKSDDIEDYIGSHPFDMKIVIQIRRQDFALAERLLNTKKD